MLNRLLRYWPVLEIIKRRKPEMILEVGSGSLGLGEFFPGEFTGCDINFPSKIVKNMKAVKGLATNLPFSTGSFDLVLCVDVLEHIFPPKRKQVIEETLRVSRDMVIFGCPCGKKAWEKDNVLARYYRNKGLPLPIWLEEHLKNPFPQKKQIDRIFKEKKIKYRVFSNENLELHFLIMKLETIRFVNRTFNFLTKKIPHFIGLFLRFLNFGDPYRFFFIIQKQDKC